MLEVGEIKHAVFDSENKNKPTSWYKKLFKSQRSSERRNTGIQEKPQVSDNMEIVISEDGLEMLQEKKVVKEFKQAGTNILEEYVKVYYDVVPEDLCDAIIKEYSN